MARLRPRSVFFRYLLPLCIYAITSAIAMSITGVSRWKKKELVGLKKFWDRRPFTRIVIGRSARLTLKDYIAINQMESRGIKRNIAKDILKQKRLYLSG